MSNTWTNTTFSNVARRGFAAFNQKLAPLGAFSTDFSADAVEQGTVVTSRIVPVSGAAADLQSGGASGDRTHSTIVADQTLGSVSVTMNQNFATGFHITDEEAAQIGSGVWEDTKNLLIQQKGYAVAAACTKYALNLCIPGTFTNTAAFTGAASAFDIDAVVDAGEAAMQLGWDMDSPTTMLLDTAYYSALKKDNAIQDLSASGIAVVQNGQLPKVDVFGILPCPILRNCATAYNAANYVRGFIAKPSALAVAMRATPSQAVDNLEYFELMTDPVSGASMAYRVFYVPATGKLYHIFETLFGASAAQVTAMSLIVSQ